MFDGTDPDGFVRRNGEIFAETLAYGQSLSANGLLDYNAGYLNWVKTDYSAPSEIVDLIDQNNLDIIGMQEVKSRNVGNLTAYASQIASTSSLPYNYITTPDNVNMMMSKYNLQNTTSIALTVGEERSLDKAIININGVDISFYNTHLGLNEYNDPHFSTMANILSSDSNPIIVTGDFNEKTISKYTEYLEPLGFEIAAYDNTPNNMWNKKSYCDSVFVLSRGHIDLAEFNVLKPIVYIVIII